MTIARNAGIEFERDLFALVKMETIFFAANANIVCPGTNSHRSPGYYPKWLHPITTAVNNVDK